jgi:hypothetical protein
MDERIRPGLTPRIASLEMRLRIFGIGLGLILAFASWRWGIKGWVVAPWTAGLALIFAAAGMLRPRSLAPVERIWMSVIRRIAAVNTYMILAGVYYLVVTPYALIGRLLFPDPLEQTPNDSRTYWKPHPGEADLERYRLPF